MTGARYVKHRYYAPRVSSLNPLRPDFNARAIAFKQINEILSKQENLNPNISANAIPSKEDTDGKKRTLTSGAKENDGSGIIWDENAKRKPGQYFKHWVTSDEAMMAQNGLSTEPNYGWVYPRGVDFRTARDKMVKKPQVVVSRHKINPKTGKIDKSRDIEVKRLPGRTIAERMPSGKIVNRAASRAGLIVDALGKLRCPPGTPAANQFTDVTGSNCFAISLEDIGKVIGDIAQAFATPRISNIDGVDINNVYEEGSGMRSRTSVVDRVRDIVRRDRQPSGVSPEVMRRAQQLANQEARMKEAIARRRQAVRVLKDSLGIEGDDETLTHFQLLQALQASGRLNPDFNLDDLLMLPSTDIARFDATPLGPEAGGIEDIIRAIIPEALSPGASLEDKLRAHEAVFLHTAMMKEKGISVDEASRLVKAYYEDGVGILTKERMDELSEKMWDQFKGYLDGFFELVKDDENDARKLILRLAFYGDDTQGDSVPTVDSNGNSARLIRMNPLEILHIDEEMVKPLAKDEVLSLSIKEGTEGTEAENAMAIAEAAARVQKLKEHRDKFGINLALEQGGYRERGSHLFYHEYSHTRQMDAIEEYLRANGIITSDMTASEVSNLIRIAMYQNSSGILDTSAYADGMTIEDLISAKLDILGGRYSYTTQEIIRDFIQRGKDINSPAGRMLRAVAFNETMSELWANRKRGIISGEDIDTALEWMDRPKPRTETVFNENVFVPSSSPVSIAPDIAEELGIETPKTPSVTPSPSGASSMSDRIKEGMEIAELEQEAAKIIKKARSQSKVHAQRKKFIEFFVKESFGKKSVSELNDKELEILARALDTRADGFIDDGDDKLSVSFKNMASDLRDLIEIRKERRRQLSPGVEPVVKPDTAIEESVVEEAATADVPTPEGMRPTTPPVVPGRERPKSPRVRRKERRSKIYEMLSRRMLTPEQIQQEIDKINARVNGGGEGRFGRAQDALKYVKSYARKNFGTTDLRELNDRQLLQLKEAMRVQAKKLLNAKLELSPGNAWEQSWSDEAAVADTSRLHSHGQTLMRFLSSIDDLRDLQAVQENGYDVIAPAPPSMPSFLPTPRPVTPPFLPGRRMGPIRGSESTPSSGLIDIAGDEEDGDLGPSGLRSLTQIDATASRTLRNSGSARARVQSVINQRRMNEEQSRALRDAFSGDAPHVQGNLGITNIADSLRESAEIRRILTDGGMIGSRPQATSSYGSLMDEQVENYIAPLLSAMDENPTTMDFDVEIDALEIGGDVSLQVGTEINHSGFISGEVTEQPGMRSISRGLGMAANRVLASRRASEVLGRIGIEEEQVANVQFAGELASAFLISGPVGVVGVIAKRGTRDAADKALEIAIERGFVTPEQASIISQRVLPKMGQGLPPDVLDAIEKAASSESAKRAAEKARGAANAAIEAARNLDIDAGMDKAREVVSSVRDRASSLDPFDDGVEAAREIVNSAKETLRRRASRMRAERNEPGTYDSSMSPGWYPDPSMPGQMRMWSGRVWTEQIMDSSGNVTEDADPRLSNQPGWAEYQSEMSRPQIDDPFAGWNPPDPFADLTPSLNDPFS